MNLHSPKPTAAVPGTCRCCVCTWQGFGSGAAGWPLSGGSRSCTPARQAGRREVKPGKMGDTKVFGFSSLLFLNWKKNQPTWNSQGESVLPVAVTAKWSLLSWSQSFLIYFLPLVLLRRRAKRAAWWASPSWPRSAPHKKLGRNACATGQAKILDMLGTCRGTEKGLFLTPRKNVVITQLSQLTAKDKIKSLN